MKARAALIVLPDPCLVVLVGPAGSGKTTFASRRFTPDEIVSSDALRDALTGDAGDQSANRAVFAQLHRAVARRLADRLTTVVDATNVERHARRALVRRAVAADRPVVAVVLGLPLAETLARNRRRAERAVPDAVVERHHALLARALASGALASEGFTAVHVLDGVEAIDGARVVRAGATMSSGAR